MLYMQLCSLRFLPNLFIRSAALQVRPSVSLCSKAALGSPADRLTPPSRRIQSDGKADTYWRAISISNHWMASPTQWTWVWVNSRSWRWTGRPGVLQSMGLQRVGHDWATELKEEYKERDPGSQENCGGSPCLWEWEGWESEGWEGLHWGEWAFQAEGTADAEGQRQPQSSDKRSGVVFRDYRGSYCMDRL